MIVEIIIIGFFVCAIVTALVFTYWVIKDMSNKYPWEDEF